MASNAGFKNFIGIVVSILAILATAVVAAYWIFIVWNATPVPIDQNIIPPAAYALVLYVAWSSLQRIQAHQRPPGKGWWLADLLPSVGLSVFLGATLAQAIYKQFDMLTITTAGAFFAGSVVDFVNNGRHLYPATAYVPGTGSAAEDLLHRIISGDTTAAIGPWTIKPEVIVEPVYKVRQPDGSLREVQPELIGGPTTH